MALNSKGQPVNSSWQVMTPGWAGKTAQTTWVTQYWVAVTANNSWYSSSQLSTIQWKAASWWWSLWWSSNAIGGNSNSWSQTNGNWGGNWNSNNNSSLWWTYLSSNPFSSPVTQKFQDINGNSRWSEAEADKASNPAKQDNNVNTDIITAQKKITPNSFWTDATKGWTADQFVERNNNLASDFATRWLTTDQQIRKELENNAGFRTATEADKLNTIADILNRVPVAQTHIAATTEADTIAKNYGFKDYADFSAKWGSAVASQAQSLMNDIAKYKQSGDTEAENMAKSALGEIMAQWAKLWSADRQANAQTLAQLAQMSPEAKTVVDDYNQINNLLSKWVTYDQLPGYMPGKDKAYIDQIMTWQWDKLGVKVNPAIAKEITATLDENKNYNDLQNASAVAKQKLALQRNEEDYQQAFQRQQAENKIQDENMNKMARVLGIWFSSSGLEGMDHVFQQGQQALSDITKLHDRNSADIQTTLADISDTYMHNTNLYNLAYKDSMKNATQAFQTDILNIQNKYGQTSDAAWEKIADTTKTYLTDLTNLSKWRTEQQNEMNNQLRQRYKDTETLKLQQQQQDLENFKADYNQPDDTSTNTNSNGGSSITYTPVDPTVLQNSVSSLTSTLTSNPLTAKNEQCGAGINDWLNTLGIKWNTFTDPISAKQAVTNSQTAAVGSVAVFDRSKSSTATEDQKTHGHVGVVTKVDANGKPTEVADWNRNWDGKFSVHVLNANQQNAISWYFDPKQWSAQGQTSDTWNTAGIDIPSHIDQSIWQYLNSDYLTKQSLTIFKKEPSLLAQWVQVANGEQTAEKLIKGKWTSAQPRVDALNQLAYAINPNYPQAYTRRTELSTSGTQAYQMQQSINKWLNHIIQLNWLIDKLDNKTDVQTFNKTINDLRNDLGSIDVTNFDAIANIAGPEMTKFITGKGNFTEWESDNMMNSLKNKLTTKQLHSVVDQLVDAVAWAYKPQQHANDSVWLKLDIINDDTKKEIIKAWYGKYFWYDNYSDISSDWSNNNWAWNVVGTSRF